MYYAALLTRSYTQHAIRPFIDFESNLVRQFIKLSFLIKGIDFTDLLRIFKDRSVTQSQRTSKIQNLLLFVTNEPLHEKTSIVVFEQVRQKADCTATEDS